MNFEDIMNEIKLGLTGEAEKDIIYIINKSAEYKKSPFADRITKETGKMVYNMLPDKEKQLFEQFLNDDKEEIEKKIDEATKEISECNYMKALEIIETIISNICRDNNITGNIDCVSLNNFFEMCIYTNIFKKDVLIKPTPFNFSQVYRLYGYCLYKLSRDDEAEKAYENAVFWNPIGIDALLDFAEIKYLKRQYKTFVELIKKCLKYSYDIGQIALCYFNLGRYYYAKKQFNMATNMYILSHYFKPNKASFEKLEELSKELGKEISPPSPEEMKQICDNLEIQMGVNPEIVKLAAKIGTDAKKQGNLEVARYCYDILFSLTGDKNVIDEVFNFMKKIKNN